MNQDTSTYDGVHRILVVANETAGGSELHDLVSSRIDRRPCKETLVLVTAPQLNTRVRHLFSDSDRAREEAELRLCECMERLRRRGINAAGVVGDADPIQAIEDILHSYPADELVISTHVEAQSNWLAHDVIERARAEFGLPVSHVEVDLAGRTLVLQAT